MNDLATTIKVEFIRFPYYDPDTDLWYPAVREVFNDNYEAAMTTIYPIEFEDAKSAEKTAQAIAGQLLDNYQNFVTQLLGDKHE